MAPLARKRVAAGVLFTDDENRVLLVKPTYKAGWEIPGGMAEPGESPRSAARRECREELGIDVVLGRLLILDWTVGTDPSDDGLMLIFAAERVDALRIVLNTDELSELAWCAPDELGAVLPDFMTRRVVAARAALMSSSFADLEDGWPASAKC